MTETVENLETIYKSLANLNLESQEISQIQQVNSKKRKFENISNL